MIGNLHNILNNPEEANKNWVLALNICNKHDLITYKANILNTMGTSAYNLADYNVALDRFNLALEVAQIIGDKDFIIDTYNSIAVVSHTLQNYKKAYEIYIKILDLLKSEDDDERKARYLRNMANSYYSYTSDSETAIAILKDAQELYEKIGDLQSKNDIEKDIEFIEN